MREKSYRSLSIMKRVTEILSTYKQTKFSHICVYIYTQNKYDQSGLFPEYDYITFKNKMSIIKEWKKTTLPFQDAEKSFDKNHQVKINNS